MITSLGVEALYREFTDAVTEVLAEKCCWADTPWPTCDGARRCQKAL
jgi:hypothetical protein